MFVYNWIILWSQFCDIFFFVFLFVLIENILRCSLLFDAYCKYVFTLYIFINLGAYPCLYDEFLGSDISISHRHLRFHLIYYINVSSHFDRNTRFIISFTEWISCEWLLRVKHEKICPNLVVSLNMGLII